MPLQAKARQYQNYPELLPGTEVETDTSRLDKPIWVLLLFGKEAHWNKVLQHLVRISVRNFSQDIRNESLTFFGIGICFYRERLLLGRPDVVFPWKRWSSKGNTFGQPSRRHCGHGGSIHRHMSMSEPPASAGDSCNLKNHGAPKFMISRLSAAHDHRGWLSSPNNNRVDRIKGEDEDRRGQGDFHFHCIYAYKEIAWETWHRGIGSGGSWQLRRCFASAALGWIGISCGWSGPSSRFPSVW